jgi:hypothetical protein
MSSLKRFWTTSRQDAKAAFGTDATPPRPGDAARLHPEERQKRLLKQLTVTGRFNISKSAYQKLEDVLHAAQGQPARKNASKKRSKTYHGKIWRAKAAPRDSKDLPWQT